MTDLEILNIILAAGARVFSSFEITARDETHAVVLVAGYYEALVEKQVGRYRVKLQGSKWHTVVRSKNKYVRMG